MPFAAASQAALVFLKYAAFAMWQAPYPSTDGYGAGDGGVVACRRQAEHRIRHDRLARAHCLFLVY
jgi:hypothetical protein